MIGFRTRITVYFFVTLGAWGLLRCNKHPNGPGTHYPIQLSLDREGRTEAQYSGAPIPAIVVTSDSVNFSAINWRSGKADFSATLSTLESRGKRFEAYLSWKSMPLLHAQDGSYYDSIYVTTGGELVRSNTVRVTVVNLPVVLDSIQVGTGTSMTTMPIRDTSWSYCASDNIVQVNIRLFARDLDGKVQPALSIYGDEGRARPMSVAGNPMIVTYDLPSGRFQSRLTFMVYDRNGSQVLRYVNFSRCNVPPVIDSIVVNGIKLVETTAIPIFIKSVIDSIRFAAFVHDPNLYDTVWVYWKAGRQANMHFDATGRSRMASYVCTAADCRDAISGRVVEFDTVSVLVVDRKIDTVKIDTVRKSVRLLHGSFFNSLSLGDTIFTGSDTLFRYSGAVLRDTLRLRVSGSPIDPLHDTLRYQWSATDVRRLTAGAADSAIFRSADSSRTDTVTITLTSGAIRTSRRVIVPSISHAPAIDSITLMDIQRPDTIAMLTYTGSDAVYYDTTWVDDTLVLKAFASDVDKGDQVRYYWSAKDSLRLRTATGGSQSAGYRCPAAPGFDTLTIRVEDLRKVKTQKRIRVTFTAR